MFLSSAPRLAGEGYARSAREGASPPTHVRVASRSPPQAGERAHLLLGVVYLVTTTVVPMLTRPNRSTMSWLYMRMQPYDTKPPIEPG